MLGPIGSVLGLGSGPVGRAFLDELDLRVGRSGPVLVSGYDLGRWLAQRNVLVTVVEQAPRRRKKGPPQVAADLTSLPFADGSLDAVCLAGLPSSESVVLRECVRAVRDGGMVALAANGSALLRRMAPPDTLAALMLHATLVDIEQRFVGGAWLTMGSVRHWV